MAAYYKTYTATIEAYDADDSLTATYSRAEIATHLSTAQQKRREWEEIHPCSFDPWKPIDLTDGLPWDHLTVAEKDAIGFEIVMGDCYGDCR